ncbi:hypothetical protein EVAR_79355_1 [Eumeta japonica]|uniref:Uncharacterized protein n=1 Tax=Eumeta variegata TaxID=151549 RepID=A0A4C1TFV4_EUMVA|nr:hypothetical protein EVAR_79355_1 [Eumeta japonica]
MGGGDDLLSNGSPVYLLLDNAINKKRAMHIVSTLIRRRALGEDQEQRPWRVRGGGRTSTARAAGPVCTPDGLGMSAGREPRLIKSRLIISDLRAFFLLAHRICLVPTQRDAGQETSTPKAVTDEGGRVQLLRERKDDEGSRRGVGRQRISKRRDKAIKSVAHDNRMRQPLRHRLRRR